MSGVAAWTTFGIASSCVAVGAVFAYVIVVVRGLRRSLRREEVLRRCAAALAGAADGAGVRDAALTAVVELVAGTETASWRVDADPAGALAHAAGALDVQTVLDRSDVALFPHGEGGISVLPGPSMLHATLGARSTDSLVLIGLPMRGLGYEAAVVSSAKPPPQSVEAALNVVAAAMRRAVDRLDVGAVMLERRSERRLRLMLAHASDVICILDHDLTIVHVTPAVEPMIGLPAPELLGMSWLDVVAEEDRVAARDLVSLAQGGRSARGELRLHRESGRLPYVDAVVTEVIDEDLVGFVVTCHDITQRFELTEQLAHQAFHDSLTGLANRALFHDRLTQAMARARRSADYAVLFIDLDDFKTVNDSLGHAAGDTLLQEMTSRLRECLREGDTAARLGGDEFAVLLEDIEDGAQCEAIADRILSALKVSVDLGGTEVETGASIGIALGASAAATPEELMRNADLALYDAKNTGKKRYSVFAQQMHDVAVTRLSLTSDLRKAVEHGELVVYYQPLIDLASGDVTGLEALVRWNHPRRGMLQPGEFIALAEETGLIVPLGRSVLLAALTAAVAWQDAHPEHRGLRISVNLSARQLLDPGIVHDVRTILDATGIDPDTVVLEITESVLVPGDEAVLARLKGLAALGVHLYIDDFGTGYSSLSYLQTLPVDGIKLAQEFVRSLGGDGCGSGIVSTIRGLAETLGLGAVVAEGIERPEQWDSLVSLGYTSGQGYHLAVPMPAELVPNFLSGDTRAGDVPWVGDVNQPVPEIATGRAAG